MGEGTITQTAGDGHASAEERAPRTERGRRTLRRVLDAAVEEFAELGFHAGSISGITRRAGVALGTFYTYFASKDDIFRAVVRDFSGRVRDEARGAVTPALTPLEVEAAVLGAFLRFARQHKAIYRIIDEAEFVDPASYRAHYASSVERIGARLQQGVASGEFRPDLDERTAWAIMGMNVFLGLRYAVWDDDLPTDDVVAAASALLGHGILADRHAG